MPQGRRSRLIIRRVDPWTVLKFSVLLYLSMYFVILVAGIVLWLVATATGVRGNIESFVGQLIASDKFTFESSQILKSSVIGGALLVAVGSAANVLMAVLFNLISDVVGGIGISVEERPPRRTRRIRQARAAGRALDQTGQTGPAGQPGQQDQQGQYGQAGQHGQQGSPGQQGQPDGAGRTRARQRGARAAPPPPPARGSRPTA